MESRPTLRLPLVLGLALFWTVSSVPTQGETPSSEAARPETQMMTHAAGSFDVKLAPRSPSDDESPAIARLLIDKQFHGDLDATSRGQMLSYRTAVQGSAGYVALEQVSGTLRGKKGTFVLQHSGTMDRGTPSLVLTVVPDSGAEELTGLSGSMKILIEDGKHSYEFDYSLTSAAAD